jgi:hypothetical protein
MPQTTGATGAGPALKIDYRDVVLTDLPLHTPGINWMQREGSDLPTSNTEMDWAMVTSMNQGSRFYGTSDPDAFASLSGKLGYSTVKVGYRKLWTPMRIKWEVFQEAERGAFTPIVAREMKGMSESHGFRMEHCFWTSNGPGYLFRVLGGTTTTPTINRYSGYTGQELGVLVESLNLIGAEVQGYLGTGAGPWAPRAANPNTIASYVKTKNTESVTFTGAMAGLVADDYIGLSLNDTGAAAVSRADNQTMYGLPLMIDDGSNFPAGVTTYQNINPATITSWQSQVLGNGGTPRALTEAVLNEAVGISRVRSGGTGPDVDKRPGMVFMGHILMEQAFAASLNTFKQFSAPTIVTREGFKPYAGPEIKALHYEGYPFVTGKLALRNTLFLKDSKAYSLIHNGPVEGTWWDMNGRNVAVPGTTQVELKLWSYINTAADKRNSSVRIDDLFTTQTF